jgi:hemoglobin-like flavoprotein
MSPAPQPNPLGPSERRLVRDSWSRVSPLADLFALTLYRRLFEQAPRLKSMFHTDITTQSRRVFDAFDGVVDSLDDWAVLRPLLVTLGRRHGYAGVGASDFHDLRQALHRTFEDLLGVAYTDPVRGAWDVFYGAIAAEMLAGIRSVEGEARDCDTTRFFRPPGPRV